jgi:hypothetical protein
MNAEDVINQMALKYGSCETYQDTGLVSGFLGTFQFTTYFVRPNQFRFDWSELGLASARYSVWSDGLKVFAKHYLVEGVEEQSDLSHAIDGAEGLSHGAAGNASCMLLPDMEIAQKYRTLLKLPSPVLSQTQIKSGARCHMVSACRTSTLGNGRDDLCIRESDFALLQYIREWTFTPEADAQLAAGIQEIDSSKEAEEIRQFLLNRPKKVRQHINSSTYHQVIFDGQIDETVFDGPNF